MGAGMMEEIMALETRAGSDEERLKNRLALKKLILPDGGMGDTFKVLIQAKGLPAEQSEQFTAHLHDAFNRF
jgi:SAM-dependent MidA family methyltransferase